MTIKEALVARAARAYVSGPGLDDSLRCARALAARGVAAAIGLLDARVTARSRVERVYSDALDAIAAERLDAYLSVKAPALGLDRGALGSLARRAAAVGTRVHLDSLGPDTAEATLRLLADLPDARAGFGVTLPGRWARSLADAGAVVAMGLPVRLVKGQWADGAGAPPDDRAGFGALVERLAGYDREVAIASHDLDLVRAAVARLRGAGTPCSIELLYGLPAGDVVAFARAEGVALRAYVAFGAGSLPYSLRERGPRALGWFLHDLAVPGRRGRSLLAA